MGRVWAFLSVALVLAGGAVPGAPLAESRFQGWTAAVVAGDWRDGDDEPIDAFDNARRDLTAAFQRAGLPVSDFVSLSLRPDVAEPISAAEAVRRIDQAARRGTDGCVIYFTSHGSPEGMVFGPTGELSPTMMAGLIRRWCQTRPTVVIVSACYSGIFVDGLKAPNRMILTAARRDRPSFGCGADEIYPWFDGCILESLPQAPDFLALAQLARACVARRETEAGVDSPSEPQLYVGPEMQIRLPTLRFTAEGTPGS